MIELVCDGTAIDNIDYVVYIIYGTAKSCLIRYFVDSLAKRE